MPPVRKDGQGTIRKDVEFVAKDDEEQIATGIVMVPHSVDLQGDWERPETIESFAEQFADFEEVGQASGGVMHAVFPDSHLDLAENTILEESQTIGGKEVPEGAWKQDWKVRDDQLWELIGDVLEGYSIGADAVRWNGPMDQDDLPDEVSVPEEFDDDEPVWELTEGIIQEVSAVDIPAVPQAQILETKSDAVKRLADHLGNRDGFIEEAVQRGHSEDDAERLWDYLNRAADVEGAGEPGEKSRFANIGRTVVNAVLGSDDGSDEEKSPEAPDATKEGQTLSRKNRHSEMASIDASLDVLQDAGVDHGMTRFTDREDTNFDLSEHTAREWPKPDDEDDEGDEEEEEEEEENAKDATGGDTPDDTDSMTDDTNDGEGDKDLAEKNAEQITELTDAVDSLTNAIAGDGEEDTVEIELDGETHEVPKSQVEGALGDDGDAGEDPDALKAEIDDLNQRIERINEQSGLSDQIDPARAGKSNGEGDVDGDGLDALAKVLN